MFKSPRFLMTNKINIQVKNNNNNNNESIVSLKMMGSYTFVWHSYIGLFVVDFHFWVLFLLWRGVFVCDNFSISLENLNPEPHFFLCLRLLLLFVFPFERFFLTSNCHYLKVGNMFWVPLFFPFFFSTLVLRCLDFFLWHLIHNWQESTL